MVEPAAFKGTDDDLVGRALDLDHVSELRRTSNSARASELPKH